MKKKPTWMIVVVLSLAMLTLPTMSYAESLGNSSLYNQNVAAQQSMLNNIDIDDAQEMIPNQDGREVVQEVTSQDAVDIDFIEMLGEAGDVDVKSIDDDNICITADINEPTDLLIYDDIEIEKKNLFSLVIEKKKGISAESYANALQRVASTASYNERTKQIITEGPVCKIKLKKRIIYYYASLGGGAPLQNWYKVLRSSSYIMSSQYTIKTMQLKTTYRGYCSNEPNNFDNLALREGSKNGNVINSPNKHEYYILSSPISRWFNEYYGFNYHTKTIFKYLKNGETKSATFNIRLPGN